MPQGLLSFQYAAEPKSSGMTGLAGLPLYLELAQAARLPEAIERHARVRAGYRCWTDRHMVMALVLLNLGGGDAVDAIRVLEEDEGFSALLRRIEDAGRPRRERRLLLRR